MSGAGNRAAEILDVFEKLGGRSLPLSDRNEHLGGPPADYLLGSIAEEALRGCVPAQDAKVQREADDRGISTLYDCGEMRLRCAAALKPLGLLHDRLLQDAQ